MTQIGVHEILVLAGLLLLGGAVWLWAGVPALLAYAGTVLMLTGLGLAARETRPRGKS